MPDDPVRVLVVDSVPLAGQAEGDVYPNGNWPVPIDCSGPACTHSRGQAGPTP